MATALEEEEEDIEQRISRITDVAKESCEALMPISGYADVKLVSLEEAVKPLVPLLPSIQIGVYVAKQRCKNPPADGLTMDESASIILYTMGWKPSDASLYVALNTALRSEKREQLIPWFSYLKLFVTALDRLPSIHQNVYRGVKLDFSARYQKGKIVVWWGFSSCTTTVEVLDSTLFLGKIDARTMFTIECHSGKDC